MSMELSYEDLIALDLLDQLDASELARLRSLAPEGDLRAIAESANALALLARALVPVPPPNRTKRELFARLTSMQSAGPVRSNTVRASEGEWRPLPFRGISVKELSVEASRALVTMLLRMAPGSIFPAHDHHGPEECYVVGGSVRIGGLRLAAGDFQHADAGTRHDDIVSESGCTLLLVVDRADYHMA
jgi:anti-sigma factor ChrR (cupin superfamily)